LCPAIPFTAEHIRKSVEICCQIYARFEFEPHLALTFPTERCVYLLPSVLYDRDEPSEDEAALRCHDEMFKALLDAGYYPHRLGIQSMEMLPPAEGNYLSVWHRLKHALDPSGLLAPGRYEPAILTSKATEKGCNDLSGIPYVTNEDLRGKLPPGQATTN